MSSVPPPNPSIPFLPENLEQAIQILNLLFTELKLISSNNPLIMKINTSRSTGRIFKILSKLDPNFFAGMTNQYCYQYPTLTKKWEQLCVEKGSFPSSIIISNSNNVADLADLFLKFGIELKSSESFALCSNCRSFTVPTQNTYNNLVENGEEVPQTWTSTCMVCNNQSFILTQKPV